jgi:hypothetical protein
MLHSAVFVFSCLHVIFFAQFYSFDIFLKFQALKDIQFKLEEVFGIGGLMEEMKGSIVDDLFTMHSNKLYSTIKNLEYVGFGERAEALLDILWKLGLPFMPDALFEMYERAESWKKSHRKKIDKSIA